jgi:hypothetical protein
MTALMHFAVGRGPLANPVENAEALQRAFGRVQARLKMTPEMFDRARKQIRQGQGIPMEVLRARVRT